MGGGALHFFCTWDMGTITLLWQLFSFWYLLEIWGFGFGFSWKIFAKTNPDYLLFKHTYFTFNPLVFIFILFYFLFLFFHILYKDKTQLYCVLFSSPF
jgi:hypothetical protein